MKTITRTHSCDNCGTTITDPDECLCPSCKPKKRDTLVTITTTRQFSFTLSEYRAYFGSTERMDRREMTRRLADEPNDQYIGLLTDCFAPHGSIGGNIIDQSYTVEPLI